MLKTLTIQSLSKFQVYNSVLLIIVIILCTGIQELLSILFRSKAVPQIQLYMNLRKELK